MNHLVHVAAHRIDYGTDDQVIMEVGDTTVIVSHTRWGWTVEGLGDFSMMFGDMADALDYACEISRV